ncbi:MAG: hypothetical protein ACREE2_08405 [Stellaceae bacterium]
MPEAIQSAEPASAVRFPFIPLSRAIERVREINKNAGQHPILTSDAKKLWGYTEKASGGFQTIAAIRYYGLVESIGAKDRRQLKLTADARRYFLDERPEVHDELVKKFALNPTAFADLWRHWNTEPPADAIARSTLKVEFGYAENAAAELLALYKTNLAFAKLTRAPDDSPAMVGGGGKQLRVPPPPLEAVKVGDYVQWTSNGQDQFPAPRRVNAVSDDGSHAQVFGSMTGIPINELTVVDTPEVSPPGQSVRPSAGSNVGSDGELSVLLRGNRLEITADVDRAGIRRLKDILGKYEEILAMLESNDAG